MIFDEFCKVSFETSHSEPGRAVLNVRMSNSGGVRDREKEARDGCAGGNENHRE